MPPFPANHIYLVKNNKYCLQIPNIDNQDPSKEVKDFGAILGATDTVDNKSEWNYDQFWLIDQVQKQDKTYYYSEHQDGALFDPHF
ncbi:hypothetical protein FRC11_012257, partial [Ceratobasidium sp. 423]